MSGTSYSATNTSRTAGAVRTTANAMVQKPVTRSGNVSRINPAIIQSTSELLELSTGPNAQVIHNEDEAAFSRMPPNTGDTEMIQKLPKRKRTGNGWSRSKKGANTTATESPTTTTGTAVRAEVDPSKEEWAANLRRVVFESSTAIRKSRISAETSTAVPPTQSPAHVMYSPRPELVDGERGFELRHNAAVTAQSRVYTDSEGANTSRNPGHAPARFSTQAHGRVNK